MSKHMAKRSVIDMNTRTPATMADFLNIENFLKNEKTAILADRGVSKIIDHLPGKPHNKVAKKNPKWLR